MSDAVRTVVQRLVADSRPNQPDADERLNGFLLTGGPSCCSYLDAEGDVWDWSPWDGAVTHVPDGPRKVGLVAIAAERAPELVAWLPARPASAIDCGQCRGHGAGSLPPPLAHVQCLNCHGLGWSEA